MHNNDHTHTHILSFIDIYYGWLKTPWWSQEAVINICTALIIIVLEICENRICLRLFVLSVERDKQISQTDRQTNKPVGEDGPIWIITPGIEEISNCYSSLNIDRIDSIFNLRHRRSEVTSRVNIQVLAHFSPCKWMGSFQRFTFFLPKNIPPF